MVLFSVVMVAIIILLISWGFLLLMYSIWKDSNEFESGGNTVATIVVVIIFIAMEAALFRRIILWGQSLI